MDITDPKALLPCTCAGKDQFLNDYHFPTCAACHRPAIATALAEARREGPEWQPIETCPIDDPAMRERFILVYDDQKPVYVPMVSRVENVKRWQGYKDGMPKHLQYNATHWIWAPAPAIRAAAKETP